MNSKQYQKEARKLDIYPKDLGLISHVMGLVNEAGEVAGKLKKQIRDCDRDFGSKLFKEDMRKELGDVMWYLANTAADLGFTLDEIAAANIAKLKDRQARGKLQGSGDNR